MQAGHPDPSRWPACNRNSLSAWSYREATRSSSASATVAVARELSGGMWSLPSSPYRRLHGFDIGRGVGRGIGSASLASREFRPG